MKTRLFIIMAFFLPVIFWGCSSQKTTKAMLESPYNYEIQNLGVGEEGTKLVKVWGYDKKADKAMMKAERNAVAAAVFRGIPAGNGSAKTPPLCSEHNCYEKYQKFYDDFLKPGGKYLQFVNLTNDGMPGGADRIKMQKGYKVAVKASIAHSNLRAYLEEEGMIKRLDSGF
ncbi:MAG: hypothetical protein ACOCQ6_01225 [Bacteroidota bacterium]